MWELWYCFMFLHQLYNEVVGKRFVQHSRVIGRQIKLNIDCSQAEYIFHRYFSHHELPQHLRNLKLSVDDIQLIKVLQLISVNLFQTDMDKNKSQILIGILK
jgi:hypothetical protein